MVKSFLLALLSSVGTYFYSLHAHENHAYINFYSAIFVSTLVSGLRCYTFENYA